MIFTAENVKIDVEKISGLGLNAAEFAILVDDESVTEAKLELYLHNRLGECRSVGLSKRLCDGKRCHTTSGNNMMFGTVEAELSTDLISVCEEHSHGCVDWEGID